jgi:integrase
MTRDDRRIPIGEFVCIYQRGQRRVWTADFHHDGRHGRKSLKTKNLRVARQRAAQLDRQLANGGFEGCTTASKKQVAMTIEEAIKRFITHKETEGCEPKTCTKYNGILKKFCGFAAGAGHTKLAEVDLPLVDRFRAARKPTVGPVQMHHDGGNLKRFLGWAKSRGYVAVNPLAEEHFKRPRQDPRGGPTLDQVNAILARAPKGVRPILSVLAFTGMRSGEVQRLLVVDVDFAGNWIHVVSRPGAKTKTKLSRRIPIHPRLRQILEALPSRSSGYYFTAAPSRKYPRGAHHINTKRLQEEFLKILNALQIPAGREGGFTVHSLRHFFRTFTTNAGIPERVIDIWMGHASDRSMASVYFKLSDDQSQEFMQRVPFGDGEPAANVGKEDK